MQDAFKAVVALISVTVLAVFLFVGIRTVTYTVDFNANISSTGSFTASEGLSLSRASFDFGAIVPEETENQTVTINNVSPINLKLNFTVSNFVPVEMEPYFHFSWNLTGNSLNKNSGVTVCFFLFVDEAAYNIASSWSFDITINGEQL